MTAKTPDPLNAHLAAARKSAGEAMQHLEAAIGAADDAQRPLIEEALDGLQSAVDHLDWSRPRFARAARRTPQRGAVAGVNEF